MRLKKSSTSTDKKMKRKKSTAHDVNKATEHPQKVKRVGASKKMTDHDVTIDRLVSTIEDAHDEIKKLTDSFKEITESMKKLEEILLTKADLSERGTPKEKVETSVEFSFESKDPKLINERTLFVKGFDTYLSRDDIKSALINHFGPYGEITRVFVPFDCHSGASKGYAFIDLKKPHSAISRNGSYLGERKLEVMLATSRREYDCGPDCGHCHRKRISRIRSKSFYNRSYY